MRHTRDSPDASTMRFEERDGKRWSTAKDGGVRHDWSEVPWNWVANQWRTCLRIYERRFMNAGS
jgi:hypothetical protein